MVFYRFWMVFLSFCMFFYRFCVVFFYRFCMFFYRFCMVLLSFLHFLKSFLHVFIFFAWFFYRFWVVFWIFLKILLDVLHPCNLFLKADCFQPESRLSSSPGGCLAPLSQNVNVINTNQRGRSLGMLDLLKIGLKTFQIQSRHLWHDPKCIRGELYGQGNGLQLSRGLKKKKA